MKKILAVLLVLAMTMAAVPGALAEDYGHSTGSVTDECPVYANVAITYTISIPAYISFGNLEKGTGIKTEYLTINVSNVMVEPNAGLKLSFKSDVMMAADNGATLPFSLTYGGYTVTTPINIPPTPVLFTQISDAHNTVTAAVKVNTDDINYAGAYKGTLSFGFEYYN